MRGALAILTGIWLALGWSSATWAASPPFTVKFFGAASIPLNGSTTLDVTVNNTDPAASLSGVGFTDTLPAGLVVATPNGLLSACTPGSTVGTLTATAGSGTVSQTGAAILAGGACTVQVNVTGTTAGTKVNSTQATSIEGGSGNTATASLTVTAPSPPVTVKFFGAASIGLNGSTTLDVTVNNPNAAASLSGVGFTDVLPAGLVVATPNGFLSACTPGSTIGTVTATAGSGTVSQTGAAILAGGACTVQVNVTGTTAGTKVNSTQATSIEGGSGNTATASITVNATAVPTIAKSFGAASIPLNGSTSLSFTITNPNVASSLTNVAFTDTFPAGVVVATPNNLTGSCGGGTITATAGSGTVSLSGATLTGSANCTFSVNVTGTSAGVKSNSVTVNSDQGVGNTATASITVAGPATHFTVSAPAAATSGTAFNFTVTALDASNNVATSYTGTVHFSSSDAAATLSANSTLTNGVGTFSSTLRTAGSQTITATDTVTASINGTSNAINVGGGGATHFTVAAPAAATASTPFNFTVTALDASNNVATSYTGTVHFTSSDGAAVLPANSTLSSGVGTFSATLKTDGSQTITATDTVSASITGTSNAINVGHKTSSTTLTSSQNPSSGGQPVTFTATVTGSPGTPTGTVTFADGATTLAAVAMAGGTASFTTSSLTVGVHTIVATYSGDAGFASSTATLQQAVNVPADSLKLRQMQIIGTQLAAQSAGQAISGAIDSAINDGFNDNPALTTPSESGLHLTFTGEPVEKRVLTAVPQDDVRDFTNNPFKRQTRVDDAFSALGYAPRYNKAPPPTPTTNLPRVWTGWVDVRGVFWDRNSVGADIKGNQINAIAGVTARITSNFLVGVLGGYEHLDATSLVLTGQLKGGGWTAGTYLGWKFAPHLRLDAGLAGTLLDYQGTAGTAAGTFSGNRWLASGGVTGTYDVARFVVEPSARIYALWEHDNAYTDSLGTLQTARNFSTGRASGGLKVSTPIAWTSSAVVMPYAGLYADYYFSKDDEGVAVVTPIPLVQGWSARFVSGFSVTLDGKAQISIGGELGGLGSDYTIWSVRSRASIPFN